MESNLNKSKDLDKKRINAATTKASRDAGPELLRIIAMLMVIMLHYLSKGEVIGLGDTSMPLNKIGFWIVEALSIVSVNVYVLISGYYLVKKEFKISRLVELWCQVFFYSVVIATVAVVTGIVPFSEYANLYNVQFLTLPVTSGHYWFATAYVIMYIMSPVLAVAARNMTKKQLGLTVLLLLIPLSLANTLLPYGMPGNDLGNSFVWFIELFLIAAYIRLHGIKLLNSRLLSASLYIGSALGIVLSRYCFLKLHVKVPSDHLISLATNYNYILVLAGALGLFGFFKDVKLKDGFIKRLIIDIAPYTFGVYLLHEHVALRYRWPKWLHVSESMGAMRIVHMIGTILLIFCIGVLVDMIRSVLFSLIKKVINWGLGIYYKNQEVWNYLIFGGLATVVNWIAYVVCAYGLLLSVCKASTTRYMVASVIAWVAAVLFAYVTNRTIVFKSEVKGFGPRLKEFAEFVGARVLSFVVELIMFYIMIDKLGIMDIIAKLVVGIVVIILNYIFSKLWIFKKRDAE